MPVVVKNINTIADNINFTYNLFFEMALLLGLLNDSAGLSHRKWADRIKDGIPVQHRKIIDFWGDFDRWNFLLDIITRNNMLPLKSPDIFLKFWNDLPDNAILGSLWEKPLAWQKSDEKDYRLFESANYEPLLADTSSHIKELKSFVGDFYHRHFTSYAQTIELSLLQNINSEFSFMTRHGTKKFFTRLSNKLFFEGDNLVLDSWTNKTYDAGKDLNEIVLIPNIFRAPHFLMDYKSFDDKLHISYPLQSSPFLEQHDISSEEIDYLANAFGVISEPVRLKILLSLHKKPACNKDLAEEMNLSRPTISKHISRLRLYNFIVGEEIGGNKILYSVSSNRILDLLKKFGFFPETEKLEVDSEAQ